MKCPHCKEDLGNGDEYDLMKSHKYNCNSEVAFKAVRAEEESCHTTYCTCGGCY